MTEKMPESTEAGVYRGNVQQRLLEVSKVAPIFYL